MRVNVDGQRFNVPDDATPEEIDQITRPAPALAQTPRQKMVHDIGRLIPLGPGETDAEHDQSVGNAVGMGMGMTMPNPLPFVGQFLKGSVKAVGEGAKRVAGSMFPKAMGVAEGALDPVLQQAPRSLPALPKVLEHLPGVGTPAKLYNMASQASESLAREPPVNPYPAAPQAEPPVAAPAAAPQAPQSVLPQATQAAQAAPAIAPVTNIFEGAARLTKVRELVKAVDANASAHLGVDPLDPRFAEAIGALPPEWWHGMAQVAKVNKPSPETIKDAVTFFRDRAAQALNAGK